MKRPSGLMRCVYTGSVADDPSMPDYASIPTIARHVCLTTSEIRRINSKTIMHER